MGGISAKLKEAFDHPDFVKRLKAGNESAYQDLVDSFLPWAKSFVKKKYGISEEDARDVTQDFFQRLIERIEQYDENEGRFLGLMLLGKPDETIRQLLKIPSAGALWTLRSRALAKLKEEVQKLKLKQGGQS